MRVLQHEIDIDATPQQVWRVLTGFDRYDEWNPFITHVEGRPEVGTRLRVRIAPPGGKAMTLSPKVVAVDVDERLGWLGHLGIPRVFDGAHEFILAAGSTGTTLTQRETFRGVLVPFCGGILAKTRDGFEAMNRALKVRVEQGADAGP
jgi:hypothetical protein